MFVRYVKIPKKDGSARGWRSILVRFTSLLCNVNAGKISQKHVCF